jgi:predicted ribosomally synthesized peptide with SipW-like signal peptide
MKKMKKATKRFLGIGGGVIALTLVLAMILSAVGTGAWLSDQEKSTGNSFVAGSLNLTVDGKEGNDVIHITRTNLVPYPAWSHSNGGQWILKNTGTIPGKFDVTINNIVNSENTITTPEAVAGDRSTDQGELGGLMYGKFMENPDATNPSMGWTGGPVFNSFNTAEGQTVQGIVLQPGQSIVVYLDLEWDTHPDLIDNTAQGDGLSFDVMFNFNQIH